MMQLPAATAPAALAPAPVATAAHAPGPHARIALSCGADAAMCDALATALRGTGRDVTLAPTTTDAPTTLHYVEEGRTTNALWGHLAWTGADGVRERGETLRFEVSDASLSGAMLRSYAGALVHAVHLPD